MNFTFIHHWKIQPTMKQLLFVVINCVVWMCFGQRQPTQNYTTEDGLPSSQVYDIIQDNNGYLWFATDRGLAKYNGYSFESFDVQDGLTNNCVLRFYKHHDGTIWCITLNNTIFQITKEGGFIPYKYNTLLAKTLASDIINEIVIYKQHFYISVINKSGYLKINREGSVQSTISEAYNFYVSQVVDNHIFNYKSDKIPVALDSNLMYIKADQKHRFFEATITEKRGLFGIDKQLYIIKDGIKTLVQEVYKPIGMGAFDSSSFWVGFRYGGVCFYDLEGNLTDSLLPNKSVTGVFNDHEKGLWVATLNSGVYYFKYSSIVTKRFNSSENNKVYSLTSNNDNELYLGYYDGSAYTWDGKKAKRLYTSTDNSPIEIQYYNSIDNVIINDRYSLIIPDKDKIFLDDGALKLSDNAYSDIMCSRMGSYIVLKDNATSILTPFRVKDVCASSDGHFVASLNGLYGKEGDAVFKLKGNPLFDYRVDDIDGKDQKHYAASHGAGIIIIDKDNTFNIDVEDGLYSNIVTEVLIENDSILWACSNKGLNRVVFTSDGDYSVTGVSHVDGLMSNEVFDVEIVNDTVWVATANGLSAFNKNLLNNKEVSFVDHFLSIQNVEVNDAIIELNELNSLSYTDNRLKIKYEAISFKYQGGLNYRYKLEGAEDSWNYTSHIEATYPSLKPGKFKFILQVKSESGIWENNEIQIPIKISPPFYDTWWFFSILIMVMGLLLYLFFKYRILSYNSDISRELLRKLLKYLNRNEKYLIITEKGKEVKIKTSEILYVKADRNYIEIVTTKDKIVVRQKISQFLASVPDPIEFLRIHRSYIIRIDKVDKKNTSSIMIKSFSIPVGNSYKEEYKKIIF